jgi:hypothetical protein
MDGITRKMKLLLQCKRKAFPGQTEAERWKQVYQILFPLDEEAPDPCKPLSPHRGYSSLLLFDLLFISVNFIITGPRF